MFCGERTQNEEMEYAYAKDIVVILSQKKQNYINMGVLSL
jgi:hypothetical protein